MITVSIVSHGHGNMVDRLLVQLRACPEVSRVTLTRNIPELSALASDDLISIIDNTEPKGFGTNHNAAFRLCSTPYFCVLNPDIELVDNPFPLLIECLAVTSASLAAPLVLSPEGAIDDSVRRFPTLWSLLVKAFGGPDGRYSIKQGDEPFCPDWVAGMFMLIRTPAFASLRGFDEGYFLYYEDVDICRRAQQAGMSVVVCPAVSVIHDARRASRRNMRHLWWHLSSMARYLCKSY